MISSYTGSSFSVSKRRRDSSTLPFRASFTFSRFFTTSLPRPFFMPVASANSSFSLLITFLSRCFLGCISWVSMHFLSGTFFFMSHSPRSLFFTAFFCSIRFCRSVRFTFDIDLPAGKLRGKACVLAFFADGERQLVVWNDHRRRLV